MEMKMADLNPSFEIGKTGVRLTLTQICHDAGHRATVTGYKGISDREEIYLTAYYDTMRKLCPEHPALADYEGCHA
jgi:hypothetical protein